MHILLHHTIRTCVPWVLVFQAAACFAEGLLGIDNPATNGGTTQAFAQVDAFQANDSVAMRQYGAEWQGPYSPRNDTNLGLLALRSELGVQWNGLRVGAISRTQAMVEANRDTTDLVRQYNTHSGYDTGRTYLVDYRIRGFEADGVHVSKSVPVPLANNWQLVVGAGASWLRGRQVKLETVSGQVIALNTQDFDANARQNASDSAIDTSGAGTFNPPFGAHPALSGYGQAFDVGLALEAPNGLRIAAAINDIAAQLDWKNVPNYAASFNTTTKYYDSDGYAHFNATATAQSSYHDVTQALDPKAWVGLAYSVGNYTLLAATSYTNQYWFPEFGVEMPISAQWQLKAGYDVRFKTIELALHHARGRLSLRTDDTDLNQAKAYGISAQFLIPF